MIIEKKLKFGTFLYNEETKTFHFEVKEGVISVNKVYAFAISRFILRISQKEFNRKKK